MQSPIDDLNTILSAVIAAALIANAMTYLLVLLVNHG